MLGRILLLLLLLAGAARGQAITWRFTEDPTTTCPGPFGNPTMESSPQLSAGGSVSIVWGKFSPNAPVMLWLSTDQSRTFFPACMLVPPEIVLTGATGADGSVRFTWQVPVNPPLAIVPFGVHMLGVAQAVEIGTIPPAVTSHVVNIESFR